MLYLLADNFMPNSAYLNRFLSFVKGFKGKNIECKIVYLHPDENFSKSSDVESIYTWSGSAWRCRKLNRLNYMFHKHISYCAIKRFTKQLTSEDIVITFGCMSSLHIIAKARSQVYHERTEHPDVVKAGRCPWRQQQYLKTCKDIAGIFVISSALQDYFVSIGVERSKVNVINMVVDSTRFENLEKENCHKYIAYCGTASHSKDGLDDLIRAIAIVHKSNSSINLKIFGKIPSLKEEKENLEMVKSYGLKDVVEFTGVVPSYSIPQLLKNAEILVLARPDNQQSRFGFPTKLGEYLLTQNPVVITTTGDISKFLVDGESAMLAIPGSPEDISSKILWLLNNKNKANLIGIEGAKVAHESFNYLIETEKILSIIK